MSNEHILVVDDEAEVRDLLQEYLTRQDFRISTAESVPAARATSVVAARQPASLRATPSVSRRFSSTSTRSMRAAME